MKVTKKGQSARKRFGKVFALLGLVVAVCELASYLLTGALAIAPQWAAAILGATSILMAVEKWARWQESEIEKGGHAVEASFVEWLLGHIPVEKEEQDAGEAPGPP